MAGDPPELIGCPECGCLNEHATARLAQAQEDIEALERDLRGKRSKISRLEREKHEKLRRSRKYDEAIEVLRHWQEVCAPKAREVDSAERLAAVIARLNGGHTVEELKLAVTGYARKPYVTKQGRSSSGRPSEWYADAELICRTAEHVRKGVAMAATALSPVESALASGQIERLSWRQVKAANRRFIIAALEEQFGTLLEDDSILSEGGLVSPCPRCEEGAGLGRLQIAPPDWNWIARCSACGLDETRLLAAITEEPTDDTDKPVDENILERTHGLLGPPAPE